MEAHNRGFVCVCMYVCVCMCVYVCVCVCMCVYSRTVSAYILSLQKYVRQSSIAAYDRVTHLVAIYRMSNYPTHHCLARSTLSLYILLSCFQFPFILFYSYVFTMMQGNWRQLTVRSSAAQDSVLAMIMVWRRLV